MNSKGLSEEQSWQCNNFGYYTVSNGYRKIPGDYCIGGVDLNPTVVSCGYGGLIFGLISLKTAVGLLLLGAVMYYGKPYLMAIFIALPIPDPNEYLAKIKNSLGGSKTKKTITKKGGKAEY